MSVLRVEPMPCSFVSSCAVSNHFVLDAISFVPCLLLPANRKQRLTVNGLTKVSFVYRRYRIGISIDVSPSMFVLNTSTGVPPFSEITGMLAEWLRRLLQPMVTCSPTACDEFFPEIYVSVMARALGSKGDTPRFLIHGFLLTLSTMDVLLDALIASLSTLETEVAQWYLRGDDAPARADTSLYRLLSPALFALKLLPQDACPIVLLVTDGNYQSCLGVGPCVVMNTCNAGL